MNLYDSSAVFNLLASPDFHTVMAGHAILDLTLYEVGNILWKNTRLMGDMDDKQTLGTLYAAMKLMRQMSVYSIIGEEDKVWNIAVSTGLTFYDAAYVFVARQHGMGLVTDDRKLADAASRRGIQVRVINLGGTKYRHI